MWPWGGDSVVRLESSWMGLSTFIKGTPGSSLTPFCHVRTQQNMAIYESGSRFSPGTESADALFLDFPVSRTTRNKCLWFKPPFCGVFQYQPKWAETSVKHHFLFLCSAFGARPSSLRCGCWEALETSSPSLMAWDFNCGVTMWRWWFCCFSA